MCPKKCFSLNFFILPSLLRWAVWLVVKVTSQVAGLVACSGSEKGTIFLEQHYLFVLVLLYSLGYVGSRDLASQRPAVHNQNKQRFLNETFKPRWFILLFHLAKVFDAEPKFRTLVLSFNNLLLGSLLFLLNNCSYSIVVFEALFIWLSFDA